MGFCLFNNVAIAARALQAEDGVGRILIFDWDVHHGNGTQHSFDEDPSVLYASTHQFPYYPGTGAAGEAGRGAGTGFTLNIPLPAGCGDEIYLGVLQRLLVPVTRKFRPDVILVSCGFDAHVDDPLAAMQVTGAGFGAMARGRARARGGLLRRPRRLRAGGWLRGQRPVRGHAGRARGAHGGGAPRRCPPRPRFRAEACSRPWWDAWSRSTAAGIRASAPS